MQPRLFSIFDLAVPSYFALLVTGFGFAVACAAVTVRRTGEDPDVFVDLGIAMLIAGVLGGRVLHVFTDGYFWDYVHLCTDPSKVIWPFTEGRCIDNHGHWDAVAKACHPAEADCFAWAKFWAGGLTYYGGFLAAVPTAWILLKRDRFPFWKAADVAGGAIALGLGFGRMGCLLAGCCFGAPTQAPWGLSFPPYSPASEAEEKLHLLATPASFSLPVHPTQVYESAASLAIAAVLFLYIHPRKRYDGFVFAWFLGLYAVARFFLEFLRRDDRGGGFGLSTSQWIGLILLGAGGAVHALRRPKLAAPPPVAA